MRAPREDALACRYTVGEARHLTQTRRSMSPIAPPLLALATLLLTSPRALAMREAPPAPRRHLVDPEAAPAGDTLVPATIPYRGYRLHVRDAELLKQRRGRYLVSVTVVNTGAQRVGLGPGFPVHFLQTAFDDALSRSGLLPLAPGIREALIEAAVTLAPGEVHEGLTVWVAEGATATAPTAKTDDIQPRRRERLPKRTRAARDRGDVLYASAATPPAASGGACLDLAIAGVEVVSRDGASATLEIAVANLGARALDAGAIGEGATLDLYLGGGATVTNASRRIGRIPLSALSSGDPARALPPGGRASVTERVRLEGLSRYTRVLIAQLDPGQVIDECDETNNEASVVLE